MHASCSQKTIHYQTTNLTRSNRMYFHWLVSWAVKILFLHTPSRGTVNHWCILQIKQYTMISFSQWFSQSVLKPGLQSEELQCTEDRKLWSCARECLTEHVGQTALMHHMSLRKAMERSCTRVQRTLFKFVWRWPAQSTQSAVILVWKK